ncbi:MAG TPA: hypothetical protein DCW31_03415 [Lactobacillus sp.]|nr:hypothetical protein [Lactobacillus sp.]
MLRTVTKYPVTIAKLSSFIVKIGLIVFAVWTHSLTMLSLLAIAGMLALNAHFIVFETTEDHSWINVWDLFFSIVLLLLSTVLLIVRS